jgi:glycine cleavage system aminomethyltransferase T
MLAPGRIAYTLLLRPDGTVFIDATVWCLARDRYWLFTGRRSDFAFVADAVREPGVAVRDLSGAHAVLAVQGPHSARVLERHLGAVPRVAYFGFGEAKLAGASVTIGRLGYSGELGYEVIVPREAAATVWRALAADVRECGFDAANSLRVESGYIFFTNELANPVNPFELDLGRLVSFDGRAFTGSEVLRALRWRDPGRRLVGLESFAHRDPSSLHELPRAEVTSRVRSPSFGSELALGFAQAGAGAVGTVVAVSSTELARVCRLPFFDPGRVLPRRFE